MLPKHWPGLRLLASAVETLGQDRTFPDIFGHGPPRRACFGRRADRVRIHL
jgi:hypothetical protein